MNPPVRIAVSGAAGQISYALLFRLAAGEMLGKEQPIILQLLEISPAMAALAGVVMELDDCAFPLLTDVVVGDDPRVMFGDVDYALLVGARPRGQGMERKDLLTSNAGIFSLQGKALNESASRDVKVLVVGNPANTNALIASANAPDIERHQFAAMTRLDHNRAIRQLASQAKVPSTAVRRMTIWGNHSATQYPDIYHATVDGKPAIDLVDHAWFKEVFIPTVQRRGAEIIDARGASSAASAASSAIDHMRTWILGSPVGDWVSMAIPGYGSYEIDDGLFYSFPVTCNGGKYSIVNNLDISEFSYKYIKKTEVELKEERDAVRELL